MITKIAMIAGMALAAMTFDAAGQGPSGTFPTRVVTLIIPAPPGGGTDVLARAIGEQLARQWQHPVVVESVPGASGSIASQRLVRSAPDGHTLLLTVQAHEMNGYFMKLPYDTLKDFTPIAMVSRTNSVVIAAPSLGVSTLSELIRKATAEPDKLGFGSTEAGSRLTGELFRMRTGTQIFNVPYKSAGQLMTDVVGGQVPFTFASLAAAMPFVKSGRVRALGIVARERSALLPDVPTLAEAGIKGLDFDVWYGVLAPARMPDDLSERIAADIERALADPEVQRKIETQGLTVVRGVRTRAFAQTIESGVIRWKPVVESAGIVPN